MSFLACLILSGASMTSHYRIERNKKIVKGEVKKIEEKNSLSKSAKKGEINNETILLLFSIF